jgi:hypothetical protein
MSIGRNDLCSCGSGRKYKKCCANKPQPVQAARSTEAIKQRGLILPGFDPFHAFDGAQPWLTADGREFVIAMSRDRWLFAGRYATADGTARSTAVLQTPEPLRLSSGISVHGETVWLTGSGGVLQLSLADWSVLRWKSVDALVKPGEALQRVMPVGPHILWLFVRPSEGKDEFARIVDATTWQILGESSGLARATLHAQPGEPQVVARIGKHARLYTAYGKAVDLPGISGTDGEVLEVVERPGGGGKVALFDVPPLTWGDLPYPPARDDGGGSEGELEGTGDEDLGAERWIAIATSSSAALTFIRHSSGKDRHKLVALERKGDDVGVRYLADAGRATILAHDAGCGHVAAVEIHGEEVAVVPLGADTPVIPARAYETIHNIPQVRPFLWCRMRIGARKAPPPAITEQLRDVAADERARRIREAEETASADDLVSWYWALKDGSHKEEADALLARLAERFPDHPELRLIVADGFARQGAWRWVNELLVAVDPSVFEPRAAQHLHHLLAAAATESGDLDAAQAQLSLAYRLFPPHLSLCEYQPLAMVVSTARGDEVVRDDRRPIVRFIRAVVEADKALSDGDIGAALQALDQALVWQEREVQSLARLAYAFLATPEVDAGSRSKKLWSLASYLNALEGNRLEAIVPGAVWPADRLREIELCAREWLDGYQAGGPEPTLRSALPRLSRPSAAEPVAADTSEAKKESQRLFDEGIKPHAAEIVEMNARGEVPVVVFEPWPSTRDALRKYGWKGQPVFRMSPRFKRDQAQLDWVTRRWLARKWQEGDPLRIFFAVMNGMFLVNHSPETGFTVEPGSTDADSKSWGN